MDTTSISDDVNRLHSLFASGVLMHPYLSCEHFAAKSCNNNNDNVDQNHTRPNGVCDNFVDLAVSLSMCCGVTPPPQCINNAEESSFLEKKFTCDKEIEFEIHQRRLRLASEIGGIANNNNLYPRRHIVLILCDGMGNSILQQTLNDNSFKHNSSFFIRKNEPSRLRAVFPSTTPAALTTLATAKYPGQHGKFFRYLYFWKMYLTLLTIMYCLMLVCQVGICVIRKGAISQETTRMKIVINQFSY